MLVHELRALELLLTQPAKPLVISDLHTILLDEFFHSSEYAYGANII